MNERICPCCGAPIALDATECKYRGEKVSVQQPQYQAPQYIPQQASQAPSVHAAPQAPPSYTAPAYTPTKSKTTAGILAILLGGLGIHKFYLGRI